MLKNNPLIAFVLRGYLAGFGLATVFTGLLLWFNIANLWYLVTHVEGGLLAAFLLWFFNGLVFAGAQCAVAVLLKTDRPDDDCPGGGQPVPVRIAVKAAEMPRGGRRPTRRA